MNRLLIAAAFVAAALNSSATDPYKVRVPVPEEADLDGAMAFIINYDTGEKVDSALISDNVALFNGQMDEPFAARLIVDGSRYCQFILEPGSIAVDAATRQPFGSPLNDRLREYNATLSRLVGEYNTASTPEQQQGVINRYNTSVENIIAENTDNPIGYLMFLQQAYELEPEELTAYIAKYPAFGQYTRIRKLVEMNERRAASGEGSHFIDYEIDGKRLSDYVGRDGRYLLVDYFASWCGPCKVQIGVLKEIYEKYKDSGKLDILGVAVWDEPDDTRRAIAEEQIPWECIINAGSVPTDLYGISGIPCIMLIAPDGTIVSRDRQSDELKAAVDAALAR